MADLGVQVRLSAQDEGLVGQLKLSSQEMAALAAAQRDAAAASRDLADATGASATAQQGAASSTTSAATSQNAAAGATQSLTVAQAANASSVGRQRAAYAQLGSQVSDVFAQLSSGTSIFRIIAQQGGQVAQALALLQPAGQAAASGAESAASGTEELGGKLRETADGVQGFGGKVGAVAGFLAGPWGAAILGAVSVGGLLAGTLSQGADAASDQKVATDALAKSIEDLEKVTRQSLVTGQRKLFLTQAQTRADFAAAINTRLRTQAEIDQAIARRKVALEQEDVSPEGGLNFGQSAAATQDAAISRLEAQSAYEAELIGRARSNVVRANAAVTRQLVDESLDPATAATGRFERASDLLFRKLETGRITEQSYGREMRALRAENEAAIDVAGRMVRASGAETSAQRGTTRALRESNVATRDLVRTQRELESSLGQIERRFNPAAAAARDYGQVLEDISKLEAAGALNSGDAFDYRMQALAAAAKENDKRAAERFAELSPEAEKQWDAIAVGFGDRVDRGLQDAAQNFERAGLEAADAIAGLIGGGIGGGVQNALRLFNNPLGGGRRTSPGEGLLAGNRGGISSFLFGGGESPAVRRDRSQAAAETDAQYQARVIDARARGDEPADFRSPAIGAGGFAGGLQSVAGTFETSLNKVFDRVFGEKGIFPESFSKTLGKAFGFGSLGGATGGPFGSRQGGAIGGAVGGLAGEKLLTKALGDFAGPFGSIAGGILGGVLGSVLKSTPRGSATITSADEKAAVAGNNAGLRQAASGLATSVQGGLQQIAEALGGQLGGFAVSIGVRDKNLRVDTSGSGKTKTSKGAVDFGQDEGGAIAFAISDAIADGAIQGLTPKVARALGSSDNIEKAIKEALNVQSLETLLDDIDGAISKTFRDLERQIAERNRIAAKYGFDLVKLEEQNAKDRKAAFEQVLAERTSPLQALLKDLSFGNLFEGSLTEQRDKLLGEVAKAEADAVAGKDGATQQVADLRRQLLDVSRNAFGTAGGEYAADLNSSRSAAERIIAQENERVKEQADLARGTNDKLDTNNKLTDETNSLLAEATTYLSRIADAPTAGPAPLMIGGGRSGRLPTERVASL